MGHQRSLPHAQAHRSLAAGHSNGRGCRTRGGGGKGEHGGPGSELTGARKVAEQRRISDEGGGWESSGAGHSGLKNGARRGGRGAVGEGDAGAPFYSVRGGAGRSSVGGEQAAAVVHHNGGGGGHFGRGSTEVVVGSDDGGGALAITGAEWAPRGGARAPARRRRRMRPLIQGGR
jgi:hypothetical protein